VAKKPVVAEFTAEIGKINYSTEHDKTDGSVAYMAGIPLKAEVSPDLYEELGRLWRSGQVKVTIEQVQAELNL
jgi:hypothetical protein